MKQLLLMIEIFRGLIKNVQLLMLEKNEMHKKYVKEKRDPKIFDKGKGHENQPRKHLLAQIQQ